MSNSEKVLVLWNPPLAAMKAALSASRAVATISPSHTLTSRPYSSVASTAQQRSLSPSTLVRRRVGPVDRDEAFVYNKNPARPGGSRQHRGQSFDAASGSGMLLQPHTRVITSDQLAAEVQGIYAGLALLESKCIEYDSTQKETDLSQGQYHSLISLHWSLLHEHHDFLLAS
ncbi:hypothetical protein X797_011847, partial [Metarhizium robertsii]